jgi:hypothetical protein
MKAENPVARQQLDKHVPAETDSCYIARCWVMRKTMRGAIGDILVGNGAVNTHS